MGGFLYTYAAGSSTPQATYVDSTQTTPNTNPVILNSRGECNLWLNPSLNYKFSLTDSQGNQCYTVDQVPGSPNALSASIPVTGIYSPGTNQLGFATNSTQWGLLGPSGNWTLNTPNSGSTLTLNGAAGAPAEVIAGSTTAGSNGLNISAGNNTTDYAITVSNASNTATLFQVRGDGDVLAADQNLVLHDVGWRDAPQRMVSANTILQLGDRGGSVYLQANSLVLTIPANATIAFPVGTMVSVFNSSFTGCTIGIATDNLIWLPSLGTGTRNLGAGSAVTLYKIAPTTWNVYGIGLS